MSCYYSPHKLTSPDSAPNMSKCNIDVDMISPPVSLRDSSPSQDDIRPLPLPRSSSVPTSAIKSQKVSNRFQPPIHKSSPHLHPAAALLQSILKPKTLQVHNTRPANPSSTANTPNTSTRARRNQVRSATNSIDPDSSALHSRLPPSSPALENPNRAEPLQSVHPSVKTPTRSSDSAVHVGPSTDASNNHPASLSHHASSALPQSLPNLSPSFPATLFGGLSTDDEHVTVWEPSTSKTVAGNAAPYRRNLGAWLEAHPGWEEKADELKSSKRRSAARRARAAANAFAAMCCYPVATLLTNEAANYLRALNDGDHCDETPMMTWTADDFVRLQEALFRLAQEIHSHESGQGEVDESKWAQVSAQVGGSKIQRTVVYCAYHMLTRGIRKSQREMSTNGVSRKSFLEPKVDHGGDFPAIESPRSLNPHETEGTAILNTVGPGSLPTIVAGLGTSFFVKYLRPPREPRVTVWNPSNGRTISGNAAPCRRNLEAWIRQHPGWYPKEEGQLTSSRRNRNRGHECSGPSSLPAAPGVASSKVEPESSHFHDALEGLLCLGRSPSIVMSPPNGLTVDAQLEEQVARVEAKARNEALVSRMKSVQGIDIDENEAEKLGLTSSVSSLSVENGEVSDVDLIQTSKMEL